MGSDRAQRHLNMAGLTALFTFCIFINIEFIKINSCRRVRLAYIVNNADGHSMGVTEGYFTKRSCVLESLASRQGLFIYSEGIHLSHLLLSGLTQVRYCFTDCITD